MIEETLQKEDKSLVKVLPIYLAVQVITLLLTYLDYPVYMEAYRANKYFVVNGWFGAWFILEIFGLATAIFLLVRKSWQLLFDGKARMKLAMGFFLGGLTGLLTLGIRFMPVMPQQYFIAVGALALLYISGYFFWKKRVQTIEELFP